MEYGRKEQTVYGYVSVVPREIRELKKENNWRRLRLTFSNKQKLTSNTGKTLSNGNP